MPLVHPHHTFSALLILFMPLSSPFHWEPSCHGHQWIYLTKSNGHFLALKLSVVQQHLSQLIMSSLLNFLLGYLTLPKPNSWFLNIITTTTTKAIPPPVSSISVFGSIIYPTDLTKTLESFMTLMLFLLVYQQANIQPLLSTTWLSYSPLISTWVTTVL